MKPPPQDYATAASFRSMLTTICLRPEDRQSDYERFLEQKAQDTSQSGFAPLWMPDFLFDFQQALVDWAIRKGRAALYMDTGTGKTACQLVWAQNVIERTNKPVLILTPLAVSFQTVSEAEKFGIDAVRVRDGTIGAPRIYVTNYEKLAHFSPSDFSGVVADESSRLKAFDAATLKAVLAFMRDIPYRLLCTATPAPNDYVELGTSAEALGILRRVEMLAHYFTHDSGNTSQWRLKKHAARAAFWQWVNSWARTMRKPSDLGFDDTRFVLPPLIERVHVVKEARPPDGLLFTLPAITLNEQRDERRRTIDERCELAAALVNETSEPAVVWCHLNSEGELLERLIPQAIQIKGSDSDEWKEMAAQWFVGTQCICNEPMFSAKLTTWQKDQTGTGKNSTANIEPSVLHDKKNTNNQLVLFVKNTPDDTTKLTNGSGKEQEHSKIKSTPENGSVTQTILPNEHGNSKKFKSTVTEVLPHAYGSNWRNTESASTSTPSPLKEAVLSAANVPRSTSAAADNSTLTTATKLDASEESFVPLAISDSDISETIQNDLNVPPCICGHSSGRRILISKAVMFGHGMNWQHCAHVVTFPSHSWEAYYQAIRRCYRFGQTRPVVVDLITTSGETNVLKNLQRKAKQAEAMFASLVTYTTEATTTPRQNEHMKDEVIPSWLLSNK